MIRNILCTTALVLGVICTPLWAAGPAFAERRVALIIGNSAYQNAPALPNPSRDARAIAAMFQKAGYDTVSTAYDLGNLDFKRAIRQFEDAASDSDIAVVYYAGHGIEIHGTNYVIPVDAKLASDRDADDEAIPLDRLVESVDGARKLRVIVLDACRDNPFSRNMKQQRVAMRGIAAGLGAAEPSSLNTLIAYAAKAGSQAEDGNADHSPFAVALMDNLFVPGLDVRLAFGRVRDEVLKKTGNRQEPFVYGSLGGGNVALVPGPDQPAAPTVSDLNGEKSDYTLVEKIGTKGAWQVFLTQHPTGFYADLARQQIDKLGGPDATASLPAGGTPKPTLVSVQTQNTPAPTPPAAPSAPVTIAARDTGKPSAAPTPSASPPMVVAALEPSKPATPPGPTTEEQRAWDKIKDSSNAADFRTFIKNYPTSVLAETALKHAQAIEQAEQQRLEAAKQKAAEAARIKAEQDAALAAAQQAAKAAEQARLEAEREAALKRDEEAHQAALAALAQATKDKQKADADAAKKQADQQAALAAAQQAAQTAEQARLDAEHAAQAQKEAACKNEQDRLTSLQAQGSKARDDLKQLQQGLTCDRLRPMVTAALDKANALPDVNTPTQIRSAQQELARVGCYSGTVDGTLSPATTVAVQHYQSERGKPAGAVDISDAFVSDLKKQSSRVCPLVCPSGKVADGDVCVAIVKPAPVARQKDEDKPAPSKKAERTPERAPARQQAKEAEPAPQPRVTQTSSASSGGGGHTIIGVGF